MYERKIRLAVCLLSAVVLSPTNAVGQETGDGCSFCEPCTNPDYGRLDPFHITSYATDLQIEMDCDFPYSCGELPDCSPSEEEEQSNLSTLVDDHDSAGLRTWAKRFPGRLTVVHERGLLLYRSLCRGEIVGGYKVPAAVVARLTEEVQG